MGPRAEVQVYLRVALHVLQLELVTENQPRELMKEIPLVLSPVCLPGLTPLR